MWELFLIIYSNNFISLYLLYIMFMVQWSKNNSGKKRLWLWFYKKHSLFQTLVACLSTTHEGHTTSCTDAECRHWTCIMCCRIIRYEHNFLGYWAGVCVSLRARRRDRWNWKPQVKSNSIISPAELIPTSQQHHTVNSLGSTPRTLTVTY